MAKDNSQKPNTISTQPRPDSNKGRTISKPFKPTTSPPKK